MNKKSIVCVIAALSLIGCSSAFAQDHDDHHDDRGRKPAPVRHAPPPMQHDDHPDPRGAGPDHAFHRGDRLPEQYRSNQYVVDDWRNHHLTAPPRGYHWVQTGGDYVLAAIATGVIAQLLLDH